MPLALAQVYAAPTQAPSGPVRPNPKGSLALGDDALVLSAPEGVLQFTSQTGDAEALFRSDDQLLSSLQGAEAEKSPATAPLLAAQIQYEPIPKEEERSQSTLLFWQSTASEKLFEPSSFSEYAELARHSQMHRRGAFSYSLGFNSSAIYDDNVMLSWADRRSDMQFAVGPAARFQLGSDDSALHLGANYRGAASWFARLPAQKTYEQNLGLDGGWNGGRLKTGFRIGAQSSHNSTRDAGERVGRQIYYLGFTASYPFTGKVGGEFSADGTRSTFQGLLGAHEYRIQEFLNYEWSGKTQLGIGATEGLLRPDGGLEQTYEQGLLRIVSQPTGKLSINASAGAENRQFDSGQASTLTPVFNAAASLQATGRTTLSLEGRRRTFSSASLQQQNYEATNLSFTLREMVSATLDAAVSLGAERADYKAAAKSVIVTRRDDYWFVRTSADWAIRKHCTLGAFYEFSRNLSQGDEGNPFRRNRVGVSVGLSF